jgi:homoserine kinase
VKAALPIGASITAFAPGGIGNLGPGLDILGCAVSGAGDTVRATRVAAPGVRVIEAGHPDLPNDPERHTSAIAAFEVLRRAGAPGFGIELHVQKGLPLCGGQGGSSASGVAGAFAANALLGDPLDATEMLYAALAAEERVAGRHIDNLAPSLFGGILLIRSIEPLDFMRIPAPAALRIALVHPAQQLRTVDARGVLPTSVPLRVALDQAAAVADMVAAFYTGDLHRLRGAVDDRIAEPARARLLPGFAAAKQAALSAGALGCSISGAGPTIFAFSDSDSIAESLCAAMREAYAREGIVATGRVASVDPVGARLVAS